MTATETNKQVGETTGEPIVADEPPPPADKTKSSSYVQLAMIPIMLSLQKIDLTEESPYIWYIRYVYCFALVSVLSCYVYLYFLVAKGDDTTEIYTQPPIDNKGFSILSKPGNPNKFKKTTYKAHEQNLIKQALYQEIMSAVISISLHFYFKLAVMAIMNSFMLPANLWDNELFAVYFRGAHPLTQKTLTGDKKKDRSYNERFKGENMKTSNDLAVEEAAKAKKDNEKKEHLQKCGDAMNQALDACWEAKKDDDGVLEMHEDMMECVEDVGVNYQKPDDGRTVIMQIVGTATLDKHSVGKFTDQLLKTTTPIANLLVTDNDGWTAIHWASFHGNSGPLSKLLKYNAKDAEMICTFKDSDGFTPLGLARDQNNAECVKVIEAFTKKSQ